MRRQYGPGGRGAPCGLPQHLEESSHGLALNHSLLLLRDIKEQAQMSIRCTPDALNFCAFGSSPRKCLRMPGMLPGEEEQAKASRWAVLVQWSCHAGQGWAVPWRLPQSQACRTLVRLFCLSPARLRLSSFWHRLAESLGILSPPRKNSA